MPDNSIPRLKSNRGSADIRSMETVILDQTKATPPVALDEFLANMQTPPDAVSPDAWADLVAALRYTHDLARLAQGLL